VYRADEAERVLAEWSKECPVPQGYRSEPVYRPAEVYDQAGHPLPGTVLGWWKAPDGVQACRLRLAGAAEPRWVVFDPERIVLLVRGGT
jgi:hypothetical protein